jgi:hypothetical protein
MKANPIIRWEAVLLLQAWSTAISQTANKKIAQTARIFIHLLISPNRTGPVGGTFRPVGTTWTMWWNFQ